MRTILLVLAGLLIASGFCMAQAVPGTMSQNVQVILEMQADGLLAASDIQAGTQIRITNEANGKMITVTAVERLPKSYGRVVNLSPEAARQLGVTAGDWVRLTVPRSSSQTAPGGTGAVPAQPGGNVTINNYYYIFDPDKLPELVKKAIELGRNDTFMEASPLPSIFDNCEIDDRTENVDIDGIHIIDLPNPRSKKYYRLQVGAFTNKDMAQLIYQRLAAGGFKPEIEPAGIVSRVCVPKVAAANVLAEARRLGALGFMEIWVREDN
jgi:hypothetical protein